jgi:lipopolysaccharide/colanic/teichoic acid biosynthesis glycosyltransferase
MNPTHAPKPVPCIKRIVDLLIAMPVLILLSPLLLFLSIILILIQGKPVLFSQQRPGKDGKIFAIHKFRTMRKALDVQGNLLPDEKRLSGFGRFMRSTSLDELPELWNVIKGEMSLVGPRPLLVQYLPLYNAEQARRHEVLPGITGWAQIHGRNAISWEKKFELDVWYVDHWSLMLDFKILFLTLAKVIRREGISESGQATTTYFTGSQTDTIPPEKPN